MARHTRQSLLVGALLAFALAAYSLMAGRPGDFAAGAIGMVVGAIVGAVAVIPELAVRRRSRD